MARPVTPVPTELTAWIDAVMVQGGLSRNTANQRVLRVISMANRLGVAPGELECDAVERHFAGRAPAQSTWDGYQSALRAWLAWIEQGKAGRRISAPVAFESMPDAMQRWIMAAERQASRGVLVRPSTVLDHAKTVMLLCRSIGCEPDSLPDDAVAIHFSGRDHSLQSPARYQSAVNAWLVWRDHGRIGRAAAEPFHENVTHPLLRQWAEHMEAEGKAKTTIHAYVRDVQAVVDHHQLEDARAITGGHVTSYIARRKAVRTAEGLDWQLTNANPILSAFRNFARYAGFEDPTFLIDRKHDRRRGSGKTRRATHEQVQALVDAAHDDAVSPDPKVAKVGRQMQLALYLMAYNGLRIGAVARFKPQHVYIDGVPKLEYHTKGNMGSTEVIDASQAMADLVDENYRTVKQNAYVYPASWRSGSNAGKAFTAWARLHGVVGVKCHGLRKFYVTELYNETKDIVHVGKQAGHANIGTTRLYIDDLPDERRDRAVVNMGQSMIAKSRARKSAAPSLATVTMLRKAS